MQAPAAFMRLKFAQDERQIGELNGAQALPVSVVYGDHKMKVWIKK